jgi:SAM-dependent methyltransferase
VFRGARSGMNLSEQQEGLEASTCWSDGTRAGRYDRQENRAFYQAALAKLLEGAPALVGQGVDLGCGTGFSTELLVAHYPAVRWQGIDIAGPMLELARRKPGLASATFRVASAESLPLADASVNAVVANLSWHWFGEVAGREVRRVLRPGGWLLAAVPLRLFSGASGNRALARALLAGRRNFARRASQGLRFEAARALLPGPVRVARHQLYVGRESFASGRDLLATLDSRGALAAVFGDHPPSVLPGPTPLEFSWPLALVHLQVPG